MKSLEPIKNTLNLPDILIIDDDPTITRILTMVLEKAGYTTRSAHTARTGLNEALRKTPDAILLDYMLPERSGLELLADFRQSLDLMDTPVIMLTASNEMTVVKSAIIEGVNDYLLKPIDPETLLSRLTRLLGERAPGADKSENENPCADKERTVDQDLTADEDAEPSAEETESTDNADE